jgi:predicted NAD/FAD-binding protein
MIEQEIRGQQKIAIVGTGISGMSAAWLLDMRHDITIYEQNSYVGGHSNTLDIDIDGQTMPVDTGFIVYNPVNYPNLVELFKHLRVPTKVSEMSFSASLNDGQLEYSGSGLRGLLAQPGNLFRPRFWRMLKDISRFYGQASELITDRSLEDITLGTFLKQHRYSEAFIYDHLMPMGGAIWSSSVQQMLDFPTLAFLRFFDNHGLVQLQGQPEWRTVSGGSREYMNRLQAPLKNRIRTDQRVARIEREEHGAVIVTADGQREQFDHVVLACHADEALELLAEPTEEEQKTLSHFRYQDNSAILHTDTSLLPKRSSAWASWNYIGTGQDSTNQLLCVTYLMNRLQKLPTNQPVMVTLNPSKDIDPTKIIRTLNYTHPIFDCAAIRSQPDLWNLQGQHNTWFCGAYFGSGFHEDGIQAGLAVAEKLGGLKRPWTVADASIRVGLCNEGRPLTTLGAARA